MLMTPSNLGPIGIISNESYAGLDLVLVSRLHFCPNCGGILRLQVPEVLTEKYKSTGPVELT